MGNKQNSKTVVKTFGESISQKDKTKNQKQLNTGIVDRNNFDFLYVIGRGGFGKVWKVFFKKYKKCYAMKEMYKAKIIDKRSEKSICYEKELLSKIFHP
jgi:serine/threonine protein kinase